MTSIDTSKTEAALDAAVDRLSRVTPTKSRDDLAEALRRTIVRRIGTHVPVTVGVSLKTLYRGDGQGPHSLVVDAMDEDGFLTITRDARWYNPYGDRPTQASPMTKLLGRVHRDLIVPPPFGVSDARIHGSSETTYSMPASYAAEHARGGHVSLSRVTDLDIEYGSEDAAQYAAETFGADVDKRLIDAIDDEADRAVTEALEDSPANGAGPVKLLIAGVSGRPVRCVLTDIELPFAACGRSVASLRCSPTTSSQKHGRRTHGSNHTTA